MKKVTEISFLICLISIAVFAQTKSKPKTAAIKPAESKSASAKTTSPKTAAPEKKSAEKSKSAKNTTKTEKTKTEKNKNEQPKTEKAKTEKTKTENSKAKKTAATKPQTTKSQTTKNQPEKKDSVKNSSVKNQPNKTDSAAKQDIKLKAAPAKSATTTVKPAAKNETKIPVKRASSETDKQTPRETSTTKQPQTLAETAAQPSAEPNFDAGLVVGKTYYNNTFNFSVTVPDDWEIADADFARRLKTEGFSLNPEAPKAKTASAQNNLNAANNRVQILLTAFKASPETNKNAILRVSIEDLRHLPQIKDAVDYFDSMRATYQSIKLPANFKYSETQAEKLGNMQFGFLDVQNGKGKKRLYATVRNGFALMFTLTYGSEEDLAALKNILAAGDFRRR